MAVSTNKVVNIIPTFGTSTTNVSYSVDVKETERNGITTSEEAITNEHLDFIKKYIRLDTVGDNKINLVVGKTVVSVIDLSKLVAGGTGASSEFEISRDEDDPETVIVNVKDPETDPND